MRRRLDPDVSFGVSCDVSAIGDRAMNRFGGDRCGRRRHPYLRGSGPHLHRLDRRLGRLRRLRHLRARRRCRARRWVGARAARRFGFHLADRLLERQPLAGDVGFAQRRRHPAQLRDQGRARAVIQRPARLPRALLEPGHGFGDERVIVGHRFPAPLPAAHITSSSVRFSGRTGTRPDRSDFAPHPHPKSLQLFGIMR